MFLDVPYGAMLPPSPMVFFLPHYHCRVELVKVKEGHNLHFFKGFGERESRWHLDFVLSTTAHSPGKNSQSIEERVQSNDFQEKVLIHPSSC